MALKQRKIFFFVIIFLFGILQTSFAQKSTEYFINKKTNIVFQLSLHLSLILTYISLHLNLDWELDFKLALPIILDLPLG